MAKTIVQTQRERKAALRGIQKLRRSIERDFNTMERQINQKLSKKRLVDFEDAASLQLTMSKINDMIVQLNNQLAAFGRLVRIA